MHYIYSYISCKKIFLHTKVYCSKVPFRGCMQTRATKKGQGHEDGQGLAISPNLYLVAPSAPSNLKYLL